jgi:2-iminobutanoate/2-iminopropanoate deaminase
MDKKKFFIPGAPPPIGPYSPALLVNDTLYISGQVPINIETGNLITENIELATHQILRNIKVLLAEADMTLENVVKCTIFMTDLNEFQKMNAVYASYFEGDTPARETVEISRLPMNATIEISCIAVK